MRILLTLFLSTPSISTIISCCDCCNTLSSVLKIKNLSNLYIGLNTIPTVNIIKKAIKTNNKNINISAIKVTDITNSKAKISGNGKKYTGNINVNFSVTHFKTIPGITTQIKSLTIGIDGTIYAGSNNGKLYKINKDTNAITDISLTITSKIESLTTGTDGTIYVGTDIGKLYKINKDTDTVTKTEWDANKIPYILKSGFNDNIYIATNSDELLITNQTVN